MIRKIIAYSLAGITLGILVMLLPIALFLYCSNINVISTLSESAAEKNVTGNDYNFTVSNATLGAARAASLREAAQIYGKSETYQETSPLTMSVPLMLVAVSGLFAGITVMVVAKKTRWLK
ncbi:hypothetical protein KEJ34_07280 [Candidatus Bathyarchaeota archaeon]|nr:hypothetical protein [Candidatus Bathyarchaeota archaeon]